MTIREIIARSLCRDDEYPFDSLPEGSRTYFLSEADDLIVMLRNAGLKVVGRDLTQAMVEEWTKAYPPVAAYASDDDDTINRAHALADWQAMFDAAPWGDEA